MSLYFPLSRHMLHSPPPWQRHSTIACLLKVNISAHYQYLLNLLSIECFCICSVASLVLRSFVAWYKGNSLHFNRRNPEVKFGIRGIHSHITVWSPVASSAWRGKIEPFSQTYCQGGKRLRCSALCLAYRWRPKTPRTNVKRKHVFWKAASQHQCGNYRFRCQWRILLSSLTSFWTLILSLNFSKWLLV